jgi:hypothetical protein
LFSILSGFFIPRVASAYAGDEAYNSIQQAEQAVSSAFNAVLKAESAGVNVSELIVRLNEAAENLTYAKILFGNGDFNEAIELTNRSIQTSNSVKEEASSLRGTALSQHDLAIQVSLIGLVVGVPAFLFFMFSLWRRYKAFYTRRISGMKPEAASNVED